MRAPTSLRYPLETATTSSRAFKSELHALEAVAAEATNFALRAHDWPSIHEIEQLLANWRRLRDLSDSGVSR